MFPCESACERILSTCGTESNNTPFAWAEWVFLRRCPTPASDLRWLMAAADTSQVHWRQTEPVRPHDQRSCGLHETSCSTAHTEPTHSKATKVFDEVTNRYLYCYVQILSAEGLCISPKLNPCGIIGTSPGTAIFPKTIVTKEVTKW